MKASLLFISAMLGFACLMTAQNITPMVTRTVVVDGDTIPIFMLREVEIYSLKTPKTKRAKKKLTKLVENIKTVYPYAKLAGIKLMKYEELLIAAANEKERRKFHLAHPPPGRRGESEGPKTAPVSNGPMEPSRGPTPQR